MNFAAAIHWSCFIHPSSGQSLILALDHGLGSGPMMGIENIYSIARLLPHPALTGLIVHKGVLNNLANKNFLPEALKNIALCIHLNGSSQLDLKPSNKLQLTTVESAARLGANAVSIDLIFNSENVNQLLAFIGLITDQASWVGLPVLLMLKTDSSNLEI